MYCCSTVQNRSHSKYTCTSAFYAVERKASKKDKDTKKKTKRRRDTDVSSSSSDGEDDDGSSESDDAPAKYEKPDGYKFKCGEQVIVVDNDNKVHITSPISPTTPLIITSQVLAYGVVKENEPDGIDDWLGDEDTEQEMNTQENHKVRALPHHANTLTQTTSCERTKTYVYTAGTLHVACN